jgi:UDP-N-acetylmuramoylalanine--D-glutamate ligase
MIAAATFANRAVGVFGLARSGVSAARALVAGGARVLAWDEDDARRLAAVTDGIDLEPWERWPWDSLAAVILSPGVPLTHPAPHDIVRRARSSGAEVIGDIELFARAIRPNASGPGKAPVIAVTGTNGKSTTTALIGHVLNACGFTAEVGGNIGKPALDLAPPGPKTVYVLEVSSYQIDLAPGLVPDVAVLTNLSPDHIDRHGSMENYSAVKASLLARVPKEGHAVVGVDDPYAASIYTRLASGRHAPAVAVAVGKVLGRGIFVINGKLYDAWDRAAALVGDLRAATRLPGAHNWQNAGLAYAALRPIVRDARAIMPAIQRFPGLAHRLEEVGRLGKVRFVNDSKATNADAAARALACFDAVYWIAGGRPKEGGIESLASYFPRIQRAYLIGEAADEFGRTLAQHRVDTIPCGTLDKALAVAADNARLSIADNPVVLLSPACASFDQFRDFEHRGDVFREAVNALIAAETLQEACA